MNMTKERLEQLVCNVLDWGSEHDLEFRECLVDAMGLSREEQKYFDLDDYLDDEDDDECDEDDECEEDDEDDEDEDEEIYRLKYLLNKEKCCPLDKDELWDLEELLDKYGYPEY